jgi:3-oxoacyl-(acyl-carrier-protein) synthase
MSRTVVVSGIGLVSAFGVTAESYRDGLLSGRSAVSPITSFDVSPCRTRRAAWIDGFDAAAWIAPMKLRRMDDTSRYAVVIARQALEDARYPLAAAGDDAVGVVLGTFTAGGAPTSEYLRALHQGGAAAAPALLFNSTVGNAPASLAGLEYKLRGPNVTVSQKEASSLGAIVTATDMLRSGRANALVAGGIDAIFEIFFRVHDAFHVMAPDSGACAPFDHASAGFLLGEGGFAVLLEAGSERPGEAGRYGEILGVAAGSATVAINAWPHDPAPIARTMRAALADASVSPSDIGVIYATANGAPALDRVEAAAIRQVFEPSRPVVTSLKGALGECAASGAAATVAALVCGAADAVPPIAGFHAALDEADGLNLAASCRSPGSPLALINSVGSGGALFSVVLRVRPESSL